MTQHSTFGAPPSVVHRENVGCLARYYWRIIGVGTLVFLVALGWTVWAGWQHQYDQQINQGNQRVHIRATHLKQVVGAASDHITQLRMWAESFPKHTPYHGASDIDEALNRVLHASSDGEFSLDESALSSSLPSLTSEQPLAQVLALKSSASTLAGATPLDLARSLADRLGNGMATAKYLRWSYFNSAKQDLLVLAPWAARKELIGQAPDIKTFLAQSWTYDITTKGLPENNPQRQPYWTPAYNDQAGAGLLVSRGAPVYWGDQFIGVVATDMLLDFLTEFLDDFTDREGIVLVVNEYGQILGQRGLAKSSDSAIRMIDTVVPPALLAGQTLANLNGQLVGSHRLFAATLDNPKWTVVHLLAQSVIDRRGFSDFKEQIFLALILLVGAVIVQLALWHLYVSPALQIANFVTYQDDFKERAAPKVPAAWRPWIQVLMQAFADRRRYLADLKASHDELEHRVEERTQALFNANIQLKKLATVDALTGALNRRNLFEVLEAERQRILRGASPLSVLMLDLDHFKNINDRYGHAAGDAVLCEVVRRCQESVRTIDSVFRFGGEEFLIVLPNLASAGATLLAERLRHAIAQAPVMFKGVPISMSTSVGVASLLAGESVENLMIRVDQMLYLAKKGGRNRVVAE